ncbi:MAG: tetratricopeptide repeat protein, partial [Planctomycetota bacterium]
AAKYFKLAAADASKKQGLAAKCLFEAGEALRRGGNSAEAVATFDELIAAQGSSRYVPYASLQRGIALAQGGDQRRAQAAFEKLKGEAGSKGYGERWGFEADLQLLILAEKDNPDAALEGYRRLSSSTEGKHPSVANQAKLRIGRVYVATGRCDEARAFFETILKDRAASTREIVAGAYNGLGSAFRKKKNATDVDIRAALYNYLRVIVSYGDVLDEQAEALYSAGKCFQRVPGPESINRSKTLLHRCINEHPDSSWAQEAQKG